MSQIAAAVLAQQIYHVFLTFNQKSSLNETTAQACIQFQKFSDALIWLTGPPSQTFDHSSSEFSTILAHETPIHQIHHAPAQTRTLQQMNPIGIPFRHISQTYCALNDQDTAKRATQQTDLTHSIVLSPFLLFSVTSGVLALHPHECNSSHCIEQASIVDRSYFQQPLPTATSQCQFKEVGSHEYHGHGYGHWHHHAAEQVRTRTLKG